MKLLKRVSISLIQTGNYVLSSPLEHAIVTLLELKEREPGWSDIRPNATAGPLDVARMCSWKSGEWRKVYIT